MTNGEISIRNLSDTVTEINIEGTIGVPEEAQFDPEDSRVATYRRFTESVVRMRSIRGGRIVVNIRSMGGSVADALLIHDTLASLDAEITTRCYGYVASAATLIAQAASPGRRQLSQNALYLVHRSTSASEGNAQSLSQTIELLNRTDDRIAQLYAQRSGKPAAQFLDLMDENDGNGRWLSPDEALQCGLVDRVIAPEAVSDRMLQAAGVRNLPALPQVSSRFTVKKAWQAIADLLGLSEENREIALDESAVERINAELDRRAQQIEALQQAEQVRDLEQHSAEQISRMKRTEAWHAALKAVQPSLPAPREDPAFEMDLRVRDNRDSYSQDLQRLKER